MAPIRNIFGYSLLFVCYLSIGSLIGYTGVRVLGTTPLYLGKILLTAILLGTGLFFLLMSFKQLISVLRAVPV